MNRLTKMLTGLALGAAGMYFLDPQQGKRRRASMRDQWMHLKSQTPKQMEKKMRHLQNQAKGLMHEFQGGLSQSDSGGSDDRMEETESQAGRMQSAARGASAGAGDNSFSRVGSMSSDGEMPRGQEASPGPGEGGERAPSRQPNARQKMDL
jgi:hypothetical protein